MKVSKVSAIVKRDKEKAKRKQKLGPYRLIRAQAQKTQHTAHRRKKTFENFHPCRAVDELVSVHLCGRLHMSE